MTQFPECFRFWLEAFDEVEEKFTTHYGTSAGHSTLDEARQTAIELHARNPKKWTRFRVVRPDGTPVAEGDLK